jgi:translation initiation factor IF-2
MSKVRLNDLARELEVKSQAILDVLPLVGVAEKKTHSSSVEEHEAEKVRAYIRGSADARTPADKSVRPLRSDVETKIDLSTISRPGDVLKTIISDKQQTWAVPARPGVDLPQMEKKPSAAPLRTLSSSFSTPETVDRSAVPQVAIKPVSTAPLMSTPLPYAELTETVSHTAKLTVSAPSLPRPLLEREHFLFLTFHESMLSYEYHSRTGTRSSDRGTFEQPIRVAELQDLSNHLLREFGGTIPTLIFFCESSSLDPPRK